MIIASPDGDNPLQTARDMLTDNILSTLNSIGIIAKLEGRNDICIEGKKISGIAQYVRNNCIFSHCSLLYDTDLDILTNVLNVDYEKIQSKAIRSVRSRVTNVKDHLNTYTTLTDFQNIIKHNFIRQYNAFERELSGNEPELINNIYKSKYSNDEWTFGKSPNFSLNCSKRFPGGKIDIFLDINDGIILSCAIHGDFLGTSPIHELEDIMCGVSFNLNALSGRLDEINLKLYIGDITKEQLLFCLFD